MARTYTRRADLFRAHPGEIQLTKRWVKSHDKFAEFVPPALAAVQDEFRTILGVTSGDAA